MQNAYIIKNKQIGTVVKSEIIFYAIAVNRRDRAELVGALKRMREVVGRDPVESETSNLKEDLKGKG